MTRALIILDCIIVFSLVACIPSNSSVSEKTTQNVITTMTSETVVATQTFVSTLISIQIPDVVVNARQYNQVVVLRLGQTLKVEPPSLTVEWQVDYDPDLFELLTPPEMVRMPGSAGWLFRAVATGEGQIVMTSIVSCSQPPCPLMPMRFQLIARIK